MNEEEYKEKLKSKIEENVDEYFPDQKFKVSKIELISKQSLEKLYTKTYRCELANRKVERDIYVVYTPQCFMEDRKENMNKIKNFNEYQEDLNIPKIYDFFENTNSLLLEKIEGKKLSKMLPLYMLPVLRNLYSKRIKEIIKKIASSIAKLQKISKNGEKTLKNYNFREKELKMINSDLENFGKLNSIIKDLKNKKSLSTKVYGDVKLNNIFVKGNKIKIIDFGFFENFYFHDLISFSLSLELLQKYPHINRALFERLNDYFFEEYLEDVDWDVDWDFLNKIRLVMLCHFLLFLKEYSTKKNFITKIIRKRNIKYLRKKINREIKKI